MRFRILAGAATLAISLPASADGPGWVHSRAVVSVVNVSNGGVNVRLNPDLTGCQSQGGYGGSFASVYPDHPSLNRIKADLLAALVTGQPIRLYLSDNTCKVLETVIGPY